MIKHTAKVISVQLSEPTPVQVIKSQPGQPLVLVVDGIPYTGQKQINGKTIKLLRKGRSLHLQVEGQSAFVADDFFAAATVSSAAPVQGETVVVANGDASDSTEVDLQTLLQHGSAVQIAAADTGVLSDASGNILGRPWQTWVAQAAEPVAEQTSAASATGAVAAAGAGVLGVGSVVVLVAGVAVAVGADQGGTSSQEDSAPINNPNAPAFTSAGSVPFSENDNGSVYTAVATPKTGGNISYSISGGADSAQFSIDSSSGVVRFVSSPDFEVPTDVGSNNIYDLVISATESGNTFVATRSVAVTVQDVGDVVPTVSGSSASFAENATGAVYTAVATPDVTGAAVSYSISGGADSAQFSINSSSGVVRFVSSPNFEAPIDAGGNNVYDLVVSATENGNPVVATRSVAVTVLNMAEAAPTFSSGNSASFAENATGAVYTAAASPDVAGRSITYSISGTDAARFSINSNSGALSFIGSPNFEVPTDSGGNNVYDIIIRATEVGNTFVATRSVAVTVTDVGDVAPVFTSASSISASFSENGVGAVYTAAATPDVTGAAVSYSISGGLDSARFSIDSSSGVVRFVNQPDYEIPVDFDGNNSYQFVVSAIEAGNTFVATRSLTVTVSNVAVEGPVFSSASSASFAENATGAVYTAVANPIASGASVSYGISGGADSAKFSINSSGVVSFVSSPNHESPTDAGSNNVYNLVITATEAGNTNLTTHSVAVTVTDVGDVAPSFTSGNSVSVTENTTGAVYTAVATPDVTGAAVSYSISGGADSAKFSINSSSGVVGWKSSPDFETPASAASSNVYDIVITATEANNTNTVTQTVAVTVTDVGDVAPAFTSASSATYAENATSAVYTAVASPDVAGRSITYSISGTDAARFSINSNSGVLSFIGSPNHESPADSGGNNVYDIIISATEVGNTFVATRSVAVTVTDVGDLAPTFTSANSISASFAENGTGAIYTAVATPDVTGAVVSYSISGGLDSARFSIDSSSGVVRFVSSPDFETPADADSNNSYQFVVSATEAGNTFVATRSLTVTVSDVGDVAPSFTSTSSATYAENATGAVYTAVATPDVTGAAVSYSISGGDDSAKFSINSSSGVVRFVSSPDFETPADADSNNSYQFVVSATEAGNTVVATRSLTVTVSDMGDVTPVFTSGSSSSFAENATGAVYTAVASPDVAGRSITYSISGTDAARFSINSSSGVVGFVSSPNHESATDSGGNNVYDLVIRATEANNTHAVTQSVAVTVTDVGDVAPVFSSASSATFAENGTGAVYTAVVTPDVTGAAVTFSISGGADSAKFSIDSSSGVVSFVSVPDFETSASAVSSNVYQLVVSATEAGNTLVATRSLTVTVSDVAVEGPTFSSASSAAFAENATGAVYTAVADPIASGASVSYSISGGADSAKFSINSSGVVSFVSSPNHESPTDSGSNNVYNLEVKATEAGSTNTTTHSVAVTVQDVGDVAPSFSSASSATFAENGTGAVYTAVATPDVTGAVVSYSISGGADSAKFSINSSGAVSFKSSPDFETPASAASSNVYDIVITATEANNTNTVTQTVAVTVSDVGDVSPAFTSASSATYAENATGAVYTAAASPDVAGRSITYSISGGSDSAKFSINSSSGVVGFVSSPNHESPTDSGGNNVYDIVITATEAGNTNTVTQTVAVTVSDVGDVAPVFTSANSISASFAENATSAVYTAQATPDAGGAVSYSISGGLDSARFSIDSSSGVVRFVSSPDFETPADADSNNSYQFVVSATEAGNTFVATRSLTVTVSDVGDVAPVFTSANSISASFSENGTGAIYTAQATPDAGGAVSYSISGGDDSTKFSINSSSGVVRFVSSPNHESPTDADSNNSYQFVVSATEAGNTVVATRSLTVTVSDVGDVAPSFSSGSSATFAENATGAVYTAVVTPDVAGAAVTFAISGGADSARFSINSSSGVVGFVSSPNHESATDSGGNNVYDITIRATEAGNTNTVTQTVAVTVTDVGDLAPVFSSASSATFAENGNGAVYTAVATPDVTGAVVSYSISSGDDSAKFSIDSSSGVVSFVSVPDFETPTDVGTNNIYELVISATEAGNTFVATRSLTVTVTDVVLEGPTFSSASSAAFAENATGAVYTAVATPKVSGASVLYSISGGSDSAKFSINSSGVVSFVSSPNHESPTDSGSENVYNLVITATEAGNTNLTTHSVAVTVTDVGDVAPTFTSASSATFAENATGAVYTAVATPDVMGASISFSISGGADSAKFSINSSSGVVSFVSSPNHESPTDSGSDNVCNLVITATEANNTNTVTQSVAITVTDVGDVAPAFTSASSATFAENGTGAVYTAVVTPDVAGAAVTFAISGGADSAKFSINSSGVVSFVSSPNHESPTDSGSDNVYNLVITATEAGNTNTTTHSVAVTVTDVGDLAPVFTSANSISASFAENGTGAIYTAVATPDVTGAAVSYSISGGLDSSRFSIDSSSGVVSFVSVPDFEAPADADSNNSYQFVVSATEAGNTFVATRSLTVTVSDVGDVAPTFTSTSSATFAENGTGAVYTAVATPDVAGAAVTFAISGGADSAKFSINSSSGVVGFVSSPDFETPASAASSNVYDIVITATEANNTNTVTQSVAVTVTDVGDVAPAFTSASSATFAENGTGAVYTAVVSSDVAGAAVTFAISGGADSAKFSINSSSGVVGFVSSPNHESPTDSGSNNVYNLVITATEAGNTNTVTQSVAVTVTDVGDLAPTFSSASSATFAENGNGAVYTAQATPDVTGAVVSYSISGGADSAKFSIDSSSGVVSFVSVPDFEAPASTVSSNVYQLVVSATEAGNTLVATRSLTVTVSDVAVEGPTFSSASSAAFAENATGAVYTAVATPKVSGASVSYSISGGSDSAKFSINSSGVVSFVSSPNHESPTDSGSDNVYNLVITATEAGNTNTTTHSVAVTVTDVGDVAPAFTSGSSATFAENGTGAVYTAVVTPDVAGAAVTFAISGGADSARFNINSSSGVVGFVSSPNHESPTDSGSDNVYDLVITATEANNTNTVTQSVVVTVTDVGDVAPAFTSASSATFVENGTGAVYTAVVSSDVAGAAVTFAISGGADSAQFSINSSSGVVGFVSSPNHESPTDSGSDNVYNLVITATEAGNTNTVTQSVAVTVTDVGDVAPVFTNGASISASFAENGTGAVYTAAATPDVTGAVVSYSISGGADSAKFSIDSSSGVVRFVSSPDFETPASTVSSNVYQLVVSATEANNTNTVTQSVAVTVTNVVLEGPTFTSGSSAAFAENGTGAVYTAVATPIVSGASVSYSISGGADSAQFSINSSGVVSFKSSPNRESATDAGSDNMYDIVIQATEGGNAHTTQIAVVVTVTDVGEVAPVFTSGNSVGVTENATGSVYTAVATPEVMGAAVSYSISGGLDSAQFSINSSSGVVGFVSSPNHESPTDAGGNNVYDIVISATEANNTHTVTQSVTVTVSDVGEVAPVFTNASSSASVVENATGAVYTATATPDVTGAVVSYAISGTDSAQFSINGSGVVSWKSSPDFENKTDADSNNVYDITISATEAGNTFVATRSVAITVSDIDDTAPIVKWINPGAVQLEATENGAAKDETPQVSAVGTAGEYVVVWSGVDLGSDTSIYVQKFHANGTISANSAVKLEATGKTNGLDAAPQVTAVGTTGEYVVVWSGVDSAGDNSIFVQKFHANGTISANSAVQLEATDKTNGSDVTPQVTAVGTVGEYVVTWSGVDSAGDSSIFVQKFHANGTISANSAVQLEATGKLNGADVTPRVAAVGSAGEYVVTWSGEDSGGDKSIFVQKFHANGTSSGNAVLLEAGDGYTTGDDAAVEVTAVGTAGEFVVVWAGPDATEYKVRLQKFAANGDTSGAQMVLEGTEGLTSAAPQVTSLGVAGEFVVTWLSEVNGNPTIFVQKFTASGAASGIAAQLHGAVGNDSRDDETPQVSAVGSAGAYAVTWVGVEGTGGDKSIYVQLFHANGTMNGSGVQLEPAGVTDRSDVAPQITAVGSAGEFVVTWSGAESASDTSIFVQKFNADGSTNKPMVVVSSAAELATAVVTVQSNELGKAYLVKNDIDISAGVAALTNANQTQWNEVAISAINTNTNVSTAGLIKGTYDLYAVDAAGNLSQVIRGVLQVNVSTTPIFSSASSAAFAENATGAVYTAVATPIVSGASVSYSISGGADSARFSIDSSSGVVRFVSSPNHESPTDSGGDNVYNLVITATEANNTNTVTQSVAITVTDVGDVAPAFTSASSATFAENATGAVYTAVVTPDVAGAAVTFAISGGADSAKFSINSNSGVVGFVSSPNHESATDSGGNNVYDIVITATEAGNTNTVTQSVAVTVSDVGDVAPTFTSTSSATFAENGTGAVYTAVVTPDVAGAAVTFAISGGSDSAKFSIDSSSGVVGFVSSPNHESATDSGGNNVYDIVITATEAGNTNTVTQSVAVTVTDVGDLTPVFTSASSATFAENGTGAVYTAVVTPDVAGAAVTFIISGGADSARFSIDSSSGVVRFVSSPDFETPASTVSSNVYDIVITATEANNTNTVTQSVAVTVTDVGDVAPTFTSTSSATYAENATGAVYTAVATPDVAGAAVTFAISGGADSARFSINSSSGVVGFVSSPNHESATDSGGNNVYDIVITATEAGNTNTVTQSVAVTVTDVGDLTPVFTSASSATFAENGTGAVYTAVVTPDVAGAAVTFAISGGADSARFSIDSSSGVVRFVSSPDFETPASTVSSNVYQLVVSATEANNTHTVTQSVAVTVTNVVLEGPTFTSGSSAAFAENATGAVYTAVATPIVSGAAVSYSISGGADSAQFSINSSGVVSFKSSPNHESATDAGSDNMYDIVIQATEGGNAHTTQIAVVVTVTDVGEVAPVFTSGNSVGVTENATGSVYTAVATPEVMGAAVSYSISGGLDSAQFSINSSSGVVGFVSSPNHESPTDAGGNNVYDIVISATEANNTHTVTQTVTITVSDVGEVAPVFTNASSSASVVENATGAVYTAVATPDVMGASISFSISGGADSARFSINSSGVVSFKSNPDFETPASAASSNVYDIVITATEAGNTHAVTQSVAVTVTDVGDVAPAFTSASSATYAENATGAVYTAVATPDVAGAAVTFAISGGADSAKFSINSSSGVVRWKSSPDFETPASAASNNIYNLVITATEAGNTHTVTQTVAVTVTDVGDVAPAFTSASSAAFAENATGAVYTAVVTPDVTGASISYSISGGADSARFSINSSSGVVGFVSSPNHESATDSGGNNVYDIVITATEAGNTNTVTQTVAVTVTDVGDLAPVFTSGSSVSFAESGTGAVYIAVVTPDVTGAAVTFSISGGADSARFSIDSSSGVVRFVSSPDFETPVSTVSSNVYQLVVSATEANNTHTVTQSVAVTVTNVVLEGPTFTSGSSAAFAENATGAVYTAVATPIVSGAAVSYSISGGADSAQFSINSSGVVSFVSSPDFETPASTVSSNVYQLVVSATEANNTHTVTQSVAVTVTNVVLEGPTFTSGSSAAFAENATGAVYTAVATPIVSGASVSYSISGGADSAQFSINSSGVVSFVSSPNHESPTDSGSDNVYDIVIRATEANNTNTVTQTVAVTVTDVGDVAPVFTSGASISASFAENGTGAVYTAQATPDVTGASISFSISGGADSAKFSINSSGVVGWKSSPDFETPASAASNNSYQFVVSATEAGNTVAATRSLTVTVSDVGDVAPTFTSTSSATFAENGTGAVYTAVVTPDVAGAAVTFAISGGSDSAKFSINSSSGVVRWKSSPDFETPASAASNNIYNLVITATEAGNTHTVTQTVAVTVTDVGDVAPAFTSASSAAFAENATGAVYTAVATPIVSGASVSYSISGGADSARFSINSNGVVSFVSSPDFEAPTDAGGDNVYNLVIRATEANNTNTVTQTVVVTVTDVGDVAPSFSSGSSASFAENATGAVYTAVATPDVTGASISFSISGGADSAQFSINSSSGVVGFVSSPNFEAATDVGGNNIYDLVIRATEVGNSSFEATRSVAVTVSNVLEAPVFTSGSSVSYSENGTGAVYAAVATPDVTGASVSYSISSGADSAKFSINSSSGVLRFVSSPNFEVPTDSGGNNVYDITIRATEAGNTFVATKAVAVTVTDVDDTAPLLTPIGSSASVSSAGTLNNLSIAIRSSELGKAYVVIQSINLTEVGITYLTSLNDRQWNEVNVTAVNVQTLLPGRGLMPGFYNVYAVDAAGNISPGVQMLIVNNTVTYQTTFTSGGSASFAENGTGVVYTAIATSTSTSGIAYSISGGVDSAQFSINSSSGVVSFKTSPDFDAPTDMGSNNIYDIIIQSVELGTPGYSFTSTKAVAVTVTNVLDAAPAFTSGSSATFAENGTGAVYTAVATPDVMGASVSYSISGGADSAKFSINSSSGVVGFISSPDHESATDVGGNNVYDIIISATEMGNTRIATRSVVVTVQDVSEVAPVFGGVSSATFAENGTGAVYTAVATPDVMGASVSYSISGGADSAKFSINSSGRVNWKSSPNHESPTDAGSDNIYDIIISATEMGNTRIATRSVAITVTDVADVAPVFTSGSSVSFAENDIGVAAYTAEATPDVDGATVTFSLSGEDVSRFQINTTTGVVFFNNSPNFENPVTWDGDNVYEISILATEMGNARIATRNVLITVTDVADVAPVFTSDSLVNFAENGTGVAYTALATPDVPDGVVFYSINGGADAGLFSINSSSGVVHFISSPNFEAPSDASANNVYEFTIKAEEIGNAVTGTQAVSITITDVDEVTPVFTSASSASFAENGTGAVYAAVATPNVGGAVSYSISGGADSARFSINSGSGVLSFVSSPNFETPSDTGSNNIYDIIIQAVESGNARVATRSVAVTVTDVDEVAPVVRLSSAVQLEATGKTDGKDETPQITAVGTAGEFVVTWSGVDSAGDASIFFQRLHANGRTNGSAVQLEATGKTDGADSTPQIAAVGTAGEFVVTWSGVDSAGDASIFVQRFRANGMPRGNRTGALQREATGKTDGADSTPQITAVGTGGRFVVTWSGADSNGDDSIFVQHFAVGSGPGNGLVSLVKLEATDVTSSADRTPQITAVGTAGEYVVVWAGEEPIGPFSASDDWSVFVQKFDANGATSGSAVKLEGGGLTPRDDVKPQILAVGAAGEYVVVWAGVNSSVDDAVLVQKFHANGTINGSQVAIAGVGFSYSYDPQVTSLGTSGEFVLVFSSGDSQQNSNIIAVQKFDANGAASGSLVQLQVAGVTNGSNGAHQVTALGSAGEFVVTWVGVDASVERDTSIFVQKFHANGSTSGSAVQLEATGVSNGNDAAPQVTALGTDGEFVVAWSGVDSAGDSSIFVQKFSANGSLASATAAANDATELANTVLSVLSTELGKALLVKNDLVLSTGIAALTAANGDRWNEVPITAANAATDLSADGLVNGTYDLYAVDAAGNLSQPVRGVLTVMGV